MNAQFLYDFHEKWEFCNGNDLHEFFRIETGDPSPPGNAEIAAWSARHFVRSSLKSMRLNSSSRSTIAHCRAVEKEMNLLTGLGRKP